MKLCVQFILLYYLASEGNGLVLLFFAIQEHLKMWLSLRNSKGITVHLEKAKTRGILCILTCSRMQACSCN